MLPHYRLLHFLRMAADIIAQLGVVFSCLQDTLPDEFVYFLFYGIRKTAADDNSTQRYGMSGMLLPVGAEIRDFVKALLLVGKAVFMNDHAQALS